MKKYVRVWNEEGDFWQVMDVNTTLICDAGSQQYCDKTLLILNQPNNMKKYIFAAAKALLHNLCATHAGHPEFDFDAMIAQPVIIFLRAYGYDTNDLEEFHAAQADAAWALDIDMQRM